MDSVYSWLLYVASTTFDEIIKPIRNACFAERTAENPDFPSATNTQQRVRNGGKRAEREPLT